MYTIQDYPSLLDRPEWKKRRTAILKRDRNCCRNCGSDSMLQVHHRQYHRYGNTAFIRKPWDYEDHLLVTLCRKCHEAGHHQYRIPSFSI